MGTIGAVRTALFVASAQVQVADSLRESNAPLPDCILALSKTNLGRTPPSLGYRVIESPSRLPMIEWLGPVDRTADGLCAGKPPAGLKMRDRAVDWLRRELADGPRKAADVYAAAAEAGIPERTLERAKHELRARSHRTWDEAEERGEWHWYDPDAPWPADAPFEKPYELPPLPPLGRF